MHFTIETTCKKEMTSTVSWVRTNDLPTLLRERVSATVGKAIDFRDCRGTDVLITAPPRLLGLLKRTECLENIKVGVKCGQTREVEVVLAMAHHNTQI